MAYKILIVDDEIDILEMLELYFLKEGFQVYKAEDGLKAWELIQKEEIDIAILDVMMPSIDGFRLTKMIRENYAIPIIILSAKNQDNDKILGLGLGADDFVAKPFNPLEIVARVQAQMRRAHSINSGNNTAKRIIKIGDLELDTFNCAINKNGQLIELTSIEYKILMLLMENSGKIFTKQEIYEKVWGEYFDGDDNTIMVHISNLRDKIEADAKKPTYLKTIRGLGYKIEKKII